MTIDGTAALWAGLCVQFVIRRGQPHREVLFATAGLAVAITMVLPPVANSVPRIFGASGPCTLFQNIWGVLSSGLIFLVIAAGRSHAVAAAVATVAMMLTEGWLANVTMPPPAGCVTSAVVPATSLFWWLMIIWHLSARAAALAVCLRDAAALRGHSWARGGVWWYTTGFALSMLYWMLSPAVLVTERRWLQVGDLRTDVLTGTVVAFAVAVWWPVAQRTVIYISDVTEFCSLYRALPSQGWSAAERGSLWQESLRRWPLAPHRAVYRVRIAQADHQIELRVNHEREGELQ